MRTAIRALALLALVHSGASQAEEQTAQDKQKLAIEQPKADDYIGPIEEVVVIGRYKAAATDVVAERIDKDVPVDFLDSEAISRAGDSDVAQALRRMPGVTLSRGSFVYVRGLGERYSSTQLNGARVPSPDLTRNVLPLDIFPAAIIDSLAVTKGYSPELPASFGGGNVDVRTKGVPDGPIVRFDLGSGWTNYHDKGITYKGCDDDWKGSAGGCRKQSPELLQALDLFQGEFTSQNIKTRLAGEGIDVTLDEAAQVNRDLAKQLNRFNDLEHKDMPPDYDLSGTLGNRWYAGDRWEFGAVAYGEYQRKWRNFDRENKFVSLPETDYSSTTRTVDNVDITGSINGGIRFTDDHEIDALYLYLKNSDDDTSATYGCRQGQYNDCLDPNTPTQSAIYRYRYEERRLLARQISGSHTLGDETLEMLPDSLQWLSFARNLNFSWYYNDSETHTDIPNEVTVNAAEGLNTDGSFQVINYGILSSGSALDYRYSQLHDEVETWGGVFTMPVNWRDFDVEFSGGYDYYQKGRSYDQYSYGLGSTYLAFDQIRFDTPENVFSDEHLNDPQYGLQLLPGIAGFGTESYAAAEKVSADFFKMDLLWRDTWRLMTGARWEEFQQVSVPIDLLAYSTPRIPLTADEIAEAATKEDDWYPAVSLTYIRPGFLAPEFQARFGWSETVARPDLREVTPSTYIDPLTEARVRGNPDLTTSNLTNWDLRLEWYWDVDNLSVSGFYKDISDPIETVQGGATEDNILFSYVNGDSAEVYGMEFEGLKGLGFLGGLLGDWTDWFYLQGNFTLSHSEVKIPSGGNVGNITNPDRALTQQSDWVVNAQLGFDSPNGRHSANVVYNAYGPRIFFAGVDGFGDAKEQTFNSLDVNYSYYPTEELTIKLRLKNILNDKLQIKQDGVDILTQDVGIQYLLDFTWQL